MTLVRYLWFSLYLRRRSPPEPLVDGDVLPDESRDLVGLLRLDPCDPLLHQIAALHVQEQRAVLGLNLASGDHLEEGELEEGSLYWISGMSVTSVKG